MKLLNLSTGKEVSIGDRLLCVSGILIDHRITVDRIVEPSAAGRLGLIEFTVGGEGPQQHQYPPNVFDCIWIKDNSLVTSVTYDNEHSLGHVIKEALKKMFCDGRYVYTIIVGQREWDQLRDLTSVPNVPPSGIVPEPSFMGVRVMRLQHRDNCLALEHVPLYDEEKSNG